MRSKPPSAHGASLEVILFDIGNVLLPFDRQRRLTRLLDLGATPDAVGALFASGLPEALDLGSAGVAELAAALGDLLGRAVSPEEAVDLWLSVFEPCPEMAELVATIAPRVRLGAFSDNPAFVGPLLPAGLSPELTFFSSELRAVKPTAAAFEAVSARVGAQADAILFVDDVQANVAAARAHGWTAIHFRGAAALRRALQAIGGLLA